MYLDQLDKLLKENDWMKGKMSFEITESARMSDLIPRIISFSGFGRWA